MKSCKNWWCRSKWNRWVATNIHLDHKLKGQFLQHIGKAKITCLEFTLRGLKWKTCICDPGGYRWPPTYSIWTCTINSCSFSLLAQLTIFTRFSGLALPRPFWGLNNPSGHCWPPTYSIWTPTISSFYFQVATKLTIFSSYSSLELLEPFWGPKRHFLGKQRATWVYGLMLIIQNL